MINSLTIGLGFLDVKMVVKISNYLIYYIISSATEQSNFMSCKHVTYLLEVESSEIFLNHFPIVRFISLLPVRGPTFQAILLHQPTA